MNRLLARAALPVNGRGGGGEWKAGGEPRAASDVQALLAGLAHATENDVLDLLRCDACAPDDFLEHERAEDDWMHVLELSVSPTDRCADCLDDHGLAHLSVSFVMTL